MLFKKIDAKSGDSISNAVNPFTIPPTNVTFAGHKWRKYNTLNPLSSPPFVFKLHTSSCFFDTSKMLMVTEARLRKLGANGERIDLDDNENVAPIQMIGSTFIKNLKVSINNQEVYDANSLYPYKVYLDTELSHGKEAKETWLQAAGYYSDDLEQDTLENRGW